MLVRCLKTPKRLSDVSEVVPVFKSYSSIPFWNNKNENLFGNKFLCSFFDFKNRRFVSFFLLKNWL